ncbi:hypothetical protein J6590_057845 [Homalodisca vitripennis]|nr:hypothetical protein J6590_057845 [Homalodisca vitripennis]
MASFKNVERRSVWPDVAAKVLSQFCANKKRLLYCFPANATHILQPCDTAIFKPLKMLGGKKCDFTSNEQVTFDSGVKHETIKTGFQSCGLFRFNQNAVDYSKCISKRREDLQHEEFIRNSKPTSEEYCVTKNVIEYEIGGEKLKIFNMTLKSESVIVDNKDESLYNLWKVCGENSAPQYVPNCDQTTTNVQNSPVHDESTMIYSNENDLDVGLTDLDLLNIEEMPIEIDGNIIDLGVNTVVEDDNNIDLGLFTTFASNEVDTLPNITAIKVQGNDQIGSIAQSPKPGNDKLEYVEQSDDSPNQHIEVADVICKSKEDDKSKEDEYVSCTIELLTERPHEQSINSDDHT